MCIFRKRREPDRDRLFKEGYRAGRNYTRQHLLEPVSAADRAIYGYDNFDRGWDEGTRMELAFQAKRGRAMFRNVIVNEIVVNAPVREQIVFIVP